MWVLEGLRTSLDVWCVISEAMVTFWTLEVVGILVCGVYFEGGAAVDLDVAAVEWRRIGWLTVHWRLEQGTVGCVTWVGSEVRRFRGVAR